MGQLLQACFGNHGCIAPTAQHQSQLQEYCTAFNALNYTALDPALRNCASGLAIVFGDKETTVPSKCWQGMGWDPNTPVACESKGKYGVCSSIDGLCYISSVDANNQIQVRSIYCNALTYIQLWHP